jgi:hypothetical protein
MQPWASAVGLVSSAKAADEPDVRTAHWRLLLHTAPPAMIRWWAVLAMCCLRERENPRECQASVRAAERRCSRAAPRTRAPARCATTEKSRCVDDMPCANGSLRAPAEQELLEAREMPANNFMLVFRKN